MLVSGSMRAGSFQAALDHVRELASTPICDATGNKATKQLPMDVLLLGLNAYVGLGRVTEAATVLARDIRPHAACTPGVIQVGGVG